MERDFVFIHVLSINFMRGYLWIDWHILLHLNLYLWLVWYSVSNFRMRDNVNEKISELMENSEKLVN